MKMISSIFSRYRTMSVAAKAAIWYSVCNILQKGISFLVVPLYVRLLSVSEYGQYSVFQSWRDTLIILATLNLYCGIFTKGMVDYDQDRERYASSQQGLSTVLTLGLLVVYLLGNGLWNRLLDMDTVTMLLMFAYFLFYPSLQFWSAKQRVVYRYKSMVAVTLMVSVLTPLVCLGLLHFTSLRAYAVIWGTLAAQSIVGLFFYVYIFVKGKCFFHRKYWIQALRFNVPLVPHYLSLIILGQSDRIMIKEICGESEAGIYSLAYSISMVMNVITAAINSSIVPWTYQKLKERNYAPLRSVATGCCALVTVMTFCVMLVAPEVIWILGTEEYMPAVWVIPVVALGNLCTFFYGLYSTIGFYYSKTGYVMICSLACGALNIVLNAVFLPMFGFVAAAYTTLVSYLALWCLHYAYTRKACLEQGYRISQVYNGRAMALMVGGLLLAMCGCFLVYDNFWLRYGMVAVLLAAAFLNRKKWLPMLLKSQK